MLYDDGWHPAPTLLSSPWQTFENPSCDSGGLDPTFGLTPPLVATNPIWRGPVSFYLHFAKIFAPLPIPSQRVTIRRTQDLAPFRGRSGGSETNQVHFVSSQIHPKSDQCINRCCNQVLSHSNPISKMGTMNQLDSDSKFCPNLGCIRNMQRLGNMLLFLCFVEWHIQC